MIRGSARPTTDRGVVGRMLFMKNLTRADRNYLIWLDAGGPGTMQEVPMRMVEMGFVEVIDGEPALTLEGAEVAKSYRLNDYHAGNAA